jgi:hypothetical protein
MNHLLIIHILSQDKTLDMFDFIKFMIVTSSSCKNNCVKLVLMFLLRSKTALGNHELLPNCVIKPQIPFATRAYKEAFSLFLSALPAVVKLDNVIQHLYKFFGYFYFKK